jgi:hypothetical protein
MRGTPGKKHKHHEERKAAGFKPSVARVLVPFMDNPRLYAVVPHKGDHRLVGFRFAAKRRRNVAESVNSWLCSFGLKLKGRNAALWVDTSIQMEWLVSAALLTITLRRHVHETGLYGEWFARAERDGMLAAVADAERDSRENDADLEDGAIAA